MRKILLLIGAIIAVTTGAAALPAPASEDLSTTHILKGLYDVKDWSPAPSLHTAANFAAAPAVNLPMSNEQWGWYRDVSAGGLDNRPRERSSDDWAIGWKSHFGLMPEISSRVGIPTEFKPDQRGLRLGANYRF
jgi:hypothetical protein